MNEISRRHFLKGTVAIAALHASGIEPTALADESASRPGVDLHWLDGQAPPRFVGTTWGMPWPRGTMVKGQEFGATGADGKPVPLQTWPLAYWPDGSLKWTGHATVADPAPAKLTVAAGKPATPAQAVTVQEEVPGFVIDTGVIRCRIAGGDYIIQDIERNGKIIVREGLLVCIRQDGSGETHTMVRPECFTSYIEKITVEQRGPVRAVIKLEGKHRIDESTRTWLPFTLRLYFYAGSEAIRIMHSFVFDGDPAKDFIKGLGLSFTVPMHDAPLHDRHVRFAGEGNGLWAEGVRNLTGLRRDPGAAITRKQLAGEACPPVDQFPEAVRKRLDLIPAWNDCTLSQLTADSFQIRKRTNGNCCWLAAGRGHRAAGLGYVGGASGGLAFGLRDFWQRHPTQLDIRGAASEQATATLWLWSPDAAPMDLRFYHDGMGMDTHAQQLEGLEITYEDYEKEFATATGVARSSEIMLWALPATPSRERLVEMARETQTPPVLACAPEHYHRAGVFGGIWGLPDRSTPTKTRIEDALDWYVAYYQRQIEQHGWYGFWNYGDVMHTYDRDRHVWRYDVGRLRVGQLGTVH